MRPARLSIRAPMIGVAVATVAPTFVGQRARSERFAAARSHDATMATLGDAL
jgi:hypothetical protein